MKDDWAKLSRRWQLGADEGLRMEGTRVESNGGKSGREHNSGGGLFHDGRERQFPVRA
jgi:hypothetical protein